MMIFRYEGTNLDLFYTNTSPQCVTFFLVKLDFDTSESDKNFEILRCA